MPSKKKKYNARFPAGRIKKIMQTDEEVGKVAQAVPVIISRTLELFVESLLTKTLRITNARNAKTLSPSHMKQCIISESRFDFLRDLVKNIPDIGVNEEQLSGSEAGYGNEAGASPASTSTSSSSNGGSGALQMHASEPISSTVLLQRSESYTPSSSASYASTLPIAAQQIQLPSHQQQQQSQPQPNSLKRPFNHTNSLNFYKEISLEDSSSSTTSSGREPPPKLTRLHSAPAASATTTNSIPIKIDILPNLSATVKQAASSSSNHSSSSQQLQLKTNNGGGGVASSNNFKITYKLAPTSNPPTPTVIEPPVFKLDYSNVKLPMASNDQTKPYPPVVASSSSRLLQQPTIKIDLSNISSFRNSPAQSVQSAPVALMAGSGKQQQQVPSTPTTASTPSTPLSALSSASSSGSSVCGGSSSSSSSKNPYVFQQQSAAAPSASTSTGSGSAAPLYSSVSSSTIPGMDEDYDDI